MKQLGFYINSERCTGCKTCMVSCHDHSDLNLTQKFRRVFEYSGGNFTEHQDGTLSHDVFSYYLSISCNHCSEPACVKGCPSGAMHKREDNGLVMVDQNRCIGCRYCEMRCPYGAPQYNEQTKVMNKCDGCYDRLVLGKPPVCVESCPQRAIDFGDIEQLKQKYGNVREVAPLPSSQLTQPNLIIQVHPDGKPVKSKLGRLSNAEEI